MTLPCSRFVEAAVRLGPLSAGVGACGQSFPPHGRLVSADIHRVGLDEVRQRRPWRLGQHPPDAMVHDSGRPVVDRASFGKRLAGDSLQRRRDPPDGSNLRRSRSSAKTAFARDSSSPLLTCFPRHHRIRSSQRASLQRCWRAGDPPSSRDCRSHHPCSPLPEDGAERPQQAGSFPEGRTRGVRRQGLLRRRARDPDVCRSSSHRRRCYPSPCSLYHSRRLSQAAGHVRLLVSCQRPGLSYLVTHP